MAKNKKGTFLLKALAKFGFKISDISDLLVEMDTDTEIGKHLDAIAIEQCAQQVGYLALYDNGVLKIREIALETDPKSGIMTIVKAFEVKFLGQTQKYFTIKNLLKFLLEKLTFETKK